MTDGPRVHWIQHVPYEGLGVMAAWLAERAAVVERTAAYEATHFPSPDAFDMLIVMGGPMGAFDDAKYPWLGYERALIRSAVQADKLVLGICLGAQLIAAGLGASVRRGRSPEIGWFPVEPTTDAASTAFADAFSDSLDAFHWHFDTLDLPTDAVRLAYSEACTHQAFAIGDRVLGLQFHPEMTPEEARAIAEHDGTTLPRGPWVQTADEMLARPERFEAANGWLTALLDRWAAA
ncbi:MAG TPA: type 1 glutamine amidotransferase [Gemmatimonadales bacterium]|nr:type 1 glutamine amidotransferase [Gemmatimonadales bacterium]